MKEAPTILEGDFEDTHTELILKGLILVCIAITAGISSVAIIGWALNWLLFAQISPAYIPMAQSTALSFVILSFALFVYVRKPKHPQAITFAKAGVSLVLLVCFIILIDFLTGAGLDIEQMLYPHLEKLNGIPIDRMSPITAINFLLPTCALLLLLISPEGRHRAKSAAAYLAVIVVSAGLVMILGYLYETPLLYGGTIIPVTLATAIAFVFMGTGLIAAVGQHYWPISSLTGSSVSAKLLRAFLPVIIAIILILDSFDVYIYPLIGNHALSESFTVIASIIIVGILVSKTVNIVSEDIDLADIERRQAEEKLLEASLYTRSLIEVTLDPLVTISKDGKITDVNKATESVTGVLREHLIGSDFSDYFTEPEKAREGYQQVFEKGFVRDYPLAIQHTSGKVTDVLYNASTYRNEAGKVQGVFAAARDITELKRAEEELRRYHNELEVLVQKRTAELKKKNEELEQFNRLFVGRELRMIELKKIITESKRKIADLEKEVNTIKISGRA